MVIADYSPEPLDSTDDARSRGLAGNDVTAPYASDRSFFVVVPFEALNPILTWHCVIVHECNDVRPYDSEGSVERADLSGRVDVDNQDRSARPTLLHNAHCGPVLLPHNYYDLVRWTSLLG